MSLCFKNWRFTKSIPKKKAINFKNQGVYDKESENIAAENCGESSFQEGLSWRGGRRVVELGVLAEALGKYCGEGCSSRLDLRNTESEKRYGFASLLWVRCVECGAFNSINTSKSRHVKKKGAPVYDVNTKTARAMIQSELSVTGMQKFMASLEVPTVSVRTLKRREREIGVKMEKVAKKSCLDATELEQNLCSLNSRAANKEGVVDLKANYHIGWQRKGSDRAYNSRSGRDVLIGTESKKILSHGRRISNFKLCKFRIANCAR